MHVPAHNLAEFEKELARQTLVSERSRCSLLAGALGLLLGVMIVYSVALAGTPVALPGMTGVMIVVAFAALFEFGNSLLLNRLLRTGRTRPPFAPYLSTFIEMALPTCAMLIIAHADTPHSAINSAAPYGYVLYIILSALRLEFRPCLFAGALAALGYGALMLAYWPHLEGAWTGSLSLLRLTLLLRVILLFLGGLAAAFVSMRIKTTLLETLRETQERARIVDLFGQHVSPAVVNQLLTQPVGQTSEQRDVCILVLDIRNFTTFSEDGILQAVLLAASLSFGVWFGPFPSSDSGMAVFVGMLGVAAMAVQNGLVRLALPGAPSTAVMTTNTAQFAVDAARLIGGRDHQADLSQIRHRAQLTLASVLGFVVGLVLGAILEVHLGLWSLTFPLVLAALSISLGEFWTSPSERVVASRA